MLEDIEKVKVIRSSLPLWLRIVLAAVFIAAVAVAAVFFAMAAYENSSDWQSKLWIIAAGLATSFVLQMPFNTPERRLFVRMCKGLITIAKWNAESWLMQAFLWFSVCTYGIAVVLAAALLCTPFAAAVYAVTG